MDVLVAVYDTKTVLEIEYIIFKIGQRIVGVVATGEEAIQKVEELKPDIVLMDMDLKGKIKGVDAGKKITDDLNVPVIFLTVFTKNCLTKSLQLPEDAITVSKPLKQDHLKYAISRALDNH